MSKLVAGSNKNSWLWIVLATTLVVSAWTAMNEDSEPAQVIPPRRLAKVDSGDGLKRVMANSASGENPHQPRAVAISDGLKRPYIKEVPLPLFSEKTEALDAGLQANIHAAPEAPALPFIYAGKLLEEGAYTVFLLSGERSLAVQRGDVIEQTWRIKSIKPPAIVFIYLPLKTEVVMNIGSAMDIGVSN